MAKPRKTNAKSTKCPTPPPTSEQKRLRRKDPSVVPSAPYLLASKLLDVACDAPVLHTVCPPNGWRSAVGELGVFPHGKLSHSYDSYFGGDVDSDVTYEDFMRAAPVSTRASNQLQATLGNYYKFAFQTSSTTLCDLTNPLALCVLCALVLMIRIFKKMFMPKFSSLGKRLGRAAHGPDWENGNQDRIVKFGEYVYRLIYHSCVSAYGLWYFRDKSWWNNDMGGTKNLWILHPNHPVEPGMAWYYLVQCAYNVDALLSLLEISFQWEWVNPFAYSSALEFLEKEHVVNETLRKKQVLKLMIQSRHQTFIWTPIFQIKWSTSVRGDFREMMAHHIVTNALIFGSSFYRFTRIGSMIFLIHDLSDVPIDMSKLANFVKWKATTIICFVVMVLMWVITRLTIFPFVIFRSVLFESYEYMVVKGTMDPALYEAYCYIFYSLLGALVLLHVTWFLILIRIGWTLVSKGETHDYSEHKLGEKQVMKKNA
ncbi:hypothetical protein HJC23_005144 [Cyclotella cryptica]|uniref:TLC domain-containing protein n=1 Tax=Cyclotella cryptica TaxID=29204 RepID=A0ABD3QMQ2_9STRA|eukprot:CCRYP_005837-RA/>CCRYP_005837-RA protein AED:0.09 eAED:0.09 QI:0/-1/0/1/-1/1/1/0/482